MEESLPTLVIVAFYDAAGLVTVSVNVSVCYSMYVCVCVVWSVLCVCVRVRGVRVCVCALWPLDVSVYMGTMDAAIVVIYDMS